MKSDSHLFSAWPVISTSTSPSGYQRLLSCSSRDGKTIEETGTGWATVLQEVGSGRYQHFFIGSSAETNHWFFKDLVNDAEFFAYLNVADENEWWLHSGHRDIARELFSDYVVDELDWIIHDDEYFDAASQSLDAIKVLAETLEVEIDETVLIEAEESLQRYGGDEDSESYDRSSGGGSVHGKHRLAV